MAQYVLIIGNKAYSSWSLRPWILLRHAGIAFGEERIALYQPDSRERMLRYSPTGRVPVLIDGDLTIWDSLSICEFLAERHPEKRLWPVEVHARANARSICAEMHSGFINLRSQLPMNVRVRMPGRGKQPEVREEIARIETIWRDCRARFGALGPFLYGQFSIADAMYAPVVTRLHTYEIELGGAAGEYAGMIYRLPAMQEWIAGAHAEAEVLQQYEP